MPFSTTLVAVRLGSQLLFFAALSLAACERAPDWSSSSGAQALVASPTPFVTSTTGSVNWSSSVTTAASPTSAIAVWRDNRDGRAGNAIVATRLLPDGSVLDPVGVLVAVPTITPYERPAVAWVNNAYLSVWSEVTTVRAARIDLSGTVIDRPGVVVATGSYGRTEPCAASNGHTVMVGWTNYVSPCCRIEVTRVDAMGARLQPDRVVSSIQAMHCEAAALGDQFAFIWRRASGSFITSAIELRRFDADGGNLDPLPVQLGVGDYPSIAASASQYLAAWASSLPDGGVIGVSAVRISSDGGVLDASPIVVSAGGVNRVHLSVTSDGTDFWVTWEVGAIGSESTHVGRVRANGTVDSVAQLSASGHQPTALAQASTALALWTESSDANLALRTIDAAGTLGPVQSVTRAAAAQQSPAAAWGATSGLVAWRETPGSSAELRFARLLSDGGTPDPTGRALVTNATASAPSVAFDGTNFLIGWTQVSPASIRVARVASDGTVIDVGGRALATSPTNGRRPTIITTTTGAWVTWRETVNIVRAVRILSNLTTLEAPRSFATGTSTSPPALVRGAGNTLLVFSSNNTTSVGTLLEDDGSVGPTIPLMSGVDPTVSFDGARFVLVARATSAAQMNALAWSADLATVFDGGVSAAYVSGAKSVFDGRSTWVTGENEQVTGWRTNIAQFDGFGRLIAPWRAVQSGALVDRDAMLLVDGTGQVLWVGSTFNPSSGNVQLTTRAVVRALGDACLDDLACAPGQFCVDGVCCDQACGGTNPNDCQACSLASGAATEGQCTVLGNTALCRAAAGACDQPETCDGLSQVCPADSFSIDGSPCDGGACSAGLCEAHDGGSAVPDASVDSGTDAGDSFFDGGNDGGLQINGNEVDGGAALDAGLGGQPGGVVRYAVGCGCSEGRSVLGLAVGLLLLHSRRRHRFTR